MQYGRWRARPDDVDMRCVGGEDLVFTGTPTTLGTALDAAARNGTICHTTPLDAAARNGTIGRMSKRQCSYVHDSASRWSQLDSRLIQLVIIG